MNCLPTTTHTGIHLQQTHQLDVPSDSQCCTVSWHMTSIMSCLSCHASMQDLHLKLCGATCPGQPLTGGLCIYVHTRYSASVWHSQLRRSEWKAGTVHCSPDTRLQREMLQDYIASGSIASMQLNLTFPACTAVFKPWEGCLFCKSAYSVY